MITEQALNGLYPVAADDGYSVTNTCPIITFISLSQHCFICQNHIALSEVCDLIMNDEMGEMWSDSHVLFCESYLSGGT
jgi:hypothetical protein